MGKARNIRLLLHSQQSTAVTWLPKPACCAELGLPCCRGQSRVWRMPSQSAMLTERSLAGVPESPGLSPMLLTQPSGMSFSKPHSLSAGTTMSERLSRMPFVSATAALLSGGPVSIGEAQPEELWTASTCMMTAWYDVLLHDVRCHEVTHRCLSWMQKPPAMQTADVCPAELAWFVLPQILCREHKEQVKCCDSSGASSISVPQQTLSNNYSAELWKERSS